MLAGLQLGMLGRFDEALSVFEYVRDRDPLYLVNLFNLAGTYFHANRWEDAAATSRTILDLNGLNEAVPVFLSLALLQMDEFEEALSAVESVAIPSWRLMLLALASYALVRQPEFESAFQELREEWGEEDTDAVATVYAYTGDVDAAFEWLDRVTPHISYPVDPYFTNLHDDPRWTAWLERMHPSMEELAAISFEVRLPTIRE